MGARSTRIQLDAALRTRIEGSGHWKVGTRKRVRDRAFTEIVRALLVVALDGLDRGALTAAQVEQAFVGDQVRRGRRRVEI